jgi:uncharacterized protein (DUF3820 family)
VDAPENLNDIKRGDDVFRFGKYRDQRVSDIDDDRYLTWVWKGGFVKDDDGSWKQIIDRSRPICRHAEELLLDKGILVVYNDRVLTAKKAEELKELSELNSKSDYIGSEGDKLELEVKVEKITYFDSFYGTTWITIMRTEDGNVVVYKGKNLDKPIYYKDAISGKVVSDIDGKFWKNLVKVGVDKGRYHTFHGNYDTNQETKNEIRSVDFKGNDVNFIDAKTLNFYNLVAQNESSLTKGDEITIKGTVKEHSEYNDTKQTRLQRVKIIK